MLVSLRPVVTEAKHAFTTSRDDIVANSMPSYVVVALSGLLLAWSVNNYRCFAANVAAAKRSGLPYVKTPVYTFNGFWLLTHPVWLWVATRVLPKSWVDPWIDYARPDFLWDKLYDMFRENGSDNVLIVSPGKITYVTADPDAITQMTTRRNDFPKPIEIYKGVDIFGKNVVSTEGQVWRHHRKITSPPFTEKNNRLVWRESLDQAQSMMQGWIADDAISTGALLDVASELMRLSLHVISRAGFGVTLMWPHEESTEPIPAGHRLSYKSALETLLLNLIMVILTPRWILKSSPLRMHRTAHQALTEWGVYMREMYDEKLQQMKDDEKSEGLDLMRALLEGVGVGTDPLTAGGAPNPDILGNAFVFILAGHETAANTLHFSILFLAMHWQSQKHLQEDLDRILGDRPVSQWTYERDMADLFGSMCGAVMNEELRVVPPVTGIPKCTPQDRAQHLHLNGQQATIPGGAFINLSTVGTHRNPKYWPHTSLQDLEEFRPERWLLDSSKASTVDPDAETHAVEDALDFEGPDRRPDTAASLFSPAKGAYVPFSEGYRSCLGRRFAQVEILAVLAVIFKTWSVELDVGEWLSDEQMATASEAQKREAWGKADARARHLLRTGMMTVITIQMRSGKVPMRFVKRGHERLRV